MASSLAVGCSAEDTRAIVEYQATPDGPRKDALLESFFRKKRGLVQSLTNKAAYSEKTAADRDDLLQAGFIGFKRAITKFDVSRRCAISTYAYTWIRHEVQALARADRPIALPRIRLTKDECARALAAWRDNPDIEPETLGISRSQMDQVKHSFGLRFVSDAVPAGVGLVDRALAETNEQRNPEEELEHQRRLRRKEHVLEQVRAGATAAALGITEEALAAVRDYIRTEEKETMTEANAPSTPAAAPQPAKRPSRGWTPQRRAAFDAKRAAPKKTGAARRRPPAPPRPAVVVVPAPPAPSRLELLLEQERAYVALLEQLVKLPPELVDRAVTAYRAA